MTTASRTDVIEESSPKDARSARATITARLVELRRQRAQAEAESLPPGAGGDLADRSTNIEALIRLENLEARIVSLELRLDELRWETGVVSGDRTVARIGSRITLSFGSGDGPETFHLDRIEQAQPGDAVITPESPLGQALLGAGPGQLISYRAGGSNRTVEILEITG